MVDHDLEKEFEDEFNDAWERYRVMPKMFKLRDDFSSIRCLNIVETNGDNATIEELDENGEAVRYSVPLSLLSNFRR